MFDTVPMSYAFTETVCLPKYACEHALIVCKLCTFDHKGLRSIHPHNCQTNYLVVNECSEWPDWPN